MKKINLFQEGSDDTLLSASRASEIAAVCNMVLAMRPGKGIKISHAESGIVVELDDALQEGLALKGDGAGGEGMEGGQAPGSLRWRGEFNYKTRDYKANDLVYASNGQLRVGSGLHNVVGHYGFFIASADIEYGDVPGSESGTYSADESNWVPFTKGYARPPFLAYDPDKPYSAGDIVYITSSDGQYIDGAGQWLALYDIEAGTYPIYRDGVYLQGQEGFLTSWRRISREDARAILVPTSVTAGTADDGMVMSATALTRKCADAEITKIRSPAARWLARQRVASL